MHMGELLSAYSLDLALVLLVYKLMPLLTAVPVLAAGELTLLKADSKVLADLRL